jgi:Zn-dependent protease with chaperone function
MECKEKRAIVGSGLVVAGFGLGIVGLAMIFQAVFAWTARLAEKNADGLAAKMEGASRTVGSVAGTLHRSFTQAARDSNSISIKGRSFAHR